MAEDNWSKRLESTKKSGDSNKKDKPDFGVQPILEHLNLKSNIFTFSVDKKNKSK